MTNPDHKLIALAIICATIVLSLAAWVGVERARTERARIEAAEAEAREQRFQKDWEAWRNE